MNISYVYPTNEVFPLSTDMFLKTLTHFLWNILIIAFLNINVLSNYFTKLYYNYKKLQQSWVF